MHWLSVIESNNNNITECTNCFLGLGPRHQDFLLDSCLEFLES